MTKSAAELLLIGWFFKFVESIGQWKKPLTIDYWGTS